MNKITFQNSEYNDTEFLTFKIDESYVSNAMEDLIRQHKGLSDEDEVKNIFVTREMNSDSYLVQIELESGITD